MVVVERAIEALSAAERDLRALVGQAAGEGDYDTVARLTESARTIGALVRAWKNGDAPSPSTLARGEGLVEPPAPVAPRRGVGAKASRGPGARLRGQRVQRSPAKGEYPKFFRRGDDLVKIGWSKKRRAEYTHKAPRRVIDALATAIAHHGADGKVFTAEDLFTADHPLTDLATGDELPGYQVYVALAWFRSAGLIDQHGRTGYSIARPEEIQKAVDSVWRTLPER